MHFQISNFKQIKKTVNPAKACTRKILRRRRKFYVQKIAAANLSNIYFLKNAKKTCKPNNRDLHYDRINDQRRQTTKSYWKKCLLLDFQPTEFLGFLVWVLSLYTSFQVSIKSKFSNDASINFRLISPTKWKYSV